jgi:hypothetical protein
MAEYKNLLNYRFQKEKSIEVNLKLGRAIAQADLWWTKWHWGRFFSEYFGFLCQFSFH